MTLEEAIIHCDEVAEKNERMCRVVHPAAQLSDYGKSVSYWDKRDVENMDKDFLRNTARFISENDIKEVEE